MALIKTNRKTYTKQT